MSWYLNPASVEYCERCRCKTWHLPQPSGERVCEWHIEEPAPPPPAPPPPQPQPHEVQP